MPAGTSAVSAQGPALPSLGLRALAGPRALQPPPCCPPPGSGVPLAGGEGCLRCVRGGSGPGASVPGAAGTEDTGLAFLAARAAVLQRSPSAASSSPKDN